MKPRSKILLVLIILAVLGFIFLVPHDDSRRAVAAYKQQLIAKGEKLTMLELAPPSSTNGIIAGRAFTNAMEGYKLPSDYPTSMKIIAPGVALVGHLNVTPLQMSSYASNSAKAAELWAILNGPELDFNLDYAKGSDISLNHLAKLKSADMLLALTALQAMHQGDYPEAWSNLTAAVYLSRMGDTPFMIAGLVRVATGRIAISASWEALQEDRWTDTQLAGLQRLWEAQDFFNKFATTLAMERCFISDSYSKLRKSGDGEALVDISNLFGAGTAPASGGFLGEARDKIKDLYDRYPRFWMWKASWSYDEELYYIQNISAAREAAEHIAASGAAYPALKDFQLQVTNLNKLFSDRGTHFLLISLSDADSDSYVKYIKKVADAETARRLLVTAIALQRFKLQHGAYPTSLADLIPTYLKQTPPDPWDGQPFRYRLKPDGDFLLYSVGEDGQDNGGDPTPATTNSTSLTDWTRARDAVWPRAATPAEAAAYNLPANTATNSPSK